MSITNVKHDDKNAVNNFYESKQQMSSCLALYNSDILMKIYSFLPYSTEFALVSKIFRKTALVRLITDVTWAVLFDKKWLSELPELLELSPDKANELLANSADRFVIVYKKIMEICEDRNFFMNTKPFECHEIEYIIRHIIEKQKNKINNFHTLFNKVFCILQKHGISTNDIDKSISERSIKTYVDKKEWWKTHKKELQMIAELDFSKCNSFMFTAVPFEIVDLIRLRRLFLNGMCEIKSLPNEMLKLKNLTTINFSNTRVGNISMICDLKMLRMLSLGGTDIVELPERLGKLKNLELLSLCDLKIDRLPSTIGKLLKLKHFFLTNTNIKKLPYEIKCLKNLEYLFVPGTQLDKLPFSVFDSLKNLTILDLANTLIEKLPDETRNLINLCRLDIRKSRINELNDVISCMTSLEMLYVCELQIKKASIKIVDLFPRLKIESNKIHPHL